jgi:septum formation protein
VTEQARALVLASASPRRRAILGQLGVAFSVQPSGVDETPLPDETPEAHVQRLARDKAFEVRARLAAEPARPWVLAADTIVLIDGSVLGKPRDDAHAERMLEQLSGRTHRVLTAMCLCEAGNARSLERLMVSEVRFRELDRATIAAYVKSGEGRDKAGSYAIQGLGAGLVREIAGSYTNVVGMPAAETIDLLLEAGVLHVWP